jgi:hypothetical protein
MPQTVGGPVVCELWFDTSEIFDILVVVTAGRIEEASLQTEFAQQHTVAWVLRTWSVFEASTS